MWDMIAKIGSVFMEKKTTKPMTPFDEVTIPFELTLLKLILPYTSAAKEQTVWILIRLMELKNTIRFFKHPEHLQTTLGLTAQSLPQSPTEILDILTPYLSPEQTQTIEQFQNVMNMMEIVQMFQAEAASDTTGSASPDPGDPGSNPFGTFNPADLMMNMLSDEQKEMFQMYQDLFSDASDSSEQTSENSAT